MTLALSRLREIDALYDPETRTETRIEALRHPDWSLRQAALWALSRYPDVRAVSAIRTLLDEEDRSDIYGGGAWGPASEDAPSELREAWRRRFRLKQAACAALGATGRLAGPTALPQEEHRRLARYAVSMGEDYPVRAAACAALGAMKSMDPAAIAALEAARRDVEWCTATHATKALAEIQTCQGAEDARQETRGS